MKNVQSLPKTVRNTVWKIYNNNLIEGLCYCCNIEVITIGNFECGHIISRYDGGSDNIYNLRPICSLCNKSMGTMNMDKFMEKYGYNTFKNNNNNLLYKEIRSEKKQYWQCPSFLTQKGVILYKQERTLLSHWLVQSKNLCKNINNILFVGDKKTSCINENCKKNLSLVQIKRNFCLHNCYKNKLYTDPLKKNNFFRYVTKFLNYKIFKV